MFQPLRLEFIKSSRLKAIRTDRRRSGYGLKGFGHRNVVTTMAACHNAGSLSGGHPEGL